VITGGSRGIGRAVALRLARDGAHCVITYRQNADLADLAVRAIEQEGARGLALALDLCDPTQVARIFDRIAEAFGRVDILVANAAATAFRPLAEQSERHVRLTLAISVESFIAAVNAAMLASIGLEALGLGANDVHTLGTTIYWAQKYSAVLRGQWWWFGPPIAMIATIFIGMFFVSVGVDRFANPRLRQQM